LFEREKEILRSSSGSVTNGMMSVQKTKCDRFHLVQILELTIKSPTTAIVENA
jgi:hypothetical protein